jgi:hypothetical protein
LLLWLLLPEKVLLDDVKEASRAFHKAFGSAQDLCETRKPAMLQQLANKAAEVQGGVQVSHHSTSQ